MGLLLDKELPIRREDDALDAPPGVAPPISSSPNSAAFLTSLQTGLVNPATAGADARERAPASSEGSRLSSAFGNAAVSRAVESGNRPPAASPLGLTRAAAPAPNAEGARTASGVAREAANDSAPSADDGGVAQAETAVTEEPAADVAGRAPDAEEAPPDAESLLGSSEIPLAGQAQAALARIDADADAKAEAVKAAAAEQRGGARAQFADLRASLTSLFETSGGSVADFITQTKAAVSAEVAAQTGAVESEAAGSSARNAESGEAARSGLAGASSGVSERVSGEESAAAGRIFQLAQAIPIPDLPGMGYIRQQLAGLAGGLAAQAREAAAGVLGMISGIFSSALSSIRSAVDAVGRAIADALASITGALAQLAAEAYAALDSFSRQATGALRSRLGEALASLDGSEAALMAEIDEAEQHALAEIEVSREGGKQTIVEILDFGYANGDYPADEGVASMMDAVDATSSAEEFHGAMIQAMEFAAAQAADDNTAALNAFRQETSEAVAGAVQGAREMAEGVGAQLSEFDSRTHDEVSQWQAQLTAGVGGVVEQARQGWASLLDTAGGELAGLVAAAEAAMRGPAEAVSQGIRSLAERAGDFFRGLVARFVGSGGGDVDASGRPALPQLGAAVAGQVQAAAAAPGALIAIPAGVAAVAGAIAAAMAKAFFYLTVLLVIIAALILLVLAVDWLIKRVRSTPRTRTRPRTRARRRTKRRRRRRRKPFKWNPSLNSPRAISSGGMPGALQSSTKGIGGTPQGHHSWPQYAGGTGPQPLMGVAQTIHQSQFHPRVDDFFRRTFGITNRTSNPSNQLFIDRLRRAADPGFRVSVGVALSGFYATLSASQCDPQIPVPAYQLGIQHTLVFLPFDR